MLHHLTSSKFIYAHGSGVENIGLATLARTDGPFSHLGNLEPCGHALVACSSTVVISGPLARNEPHSQSTPNRPKPPM
ncbi:hypothetical protein VNO77_20187 [Canavalia gladiata]|uniref:Uncharacterized protein n=1 Tax=Canavalia gladiata TaxID=3824 RepID=A0AAN9QJ54_CANGL